jgi:hypothetical protein
VEEVVSRSPGRMGPFSAEALTWTMPRMAKGILSLRSSLSLQVH